MRTSWFKYFYIWLLSTIAITLFIAFVVLLVYFDANAWIGITTVFIAWFIISCITSFFIFNSERLLNVKLCWILWVMCFPLLGLIIFYWFGIFPFKKNKLKEYSKLLNAYYDKEQFKFTKEFLNSIQTNKDIKKAFKYGLNINQPILLNNDLVLLDHIDEFYNAIMQTINDAKKFINVQTYIVKKSAFFNVLADLLIKKAHEGIKINFMYDWIGGLINNPKTKINEMKKAGINVATFNTFRFNPFTGQTNYRSHRKCLIVDNKIAIYGGSNLSDDYFNLVMKNNFWKDINIKIEGEIVNSLNIMFAIDWQNYTLNSINRNIKNIFINNKEFYFSKNKEIHLQNNICQMVESSPLLKENTIHDIIINLIGLANERIWIITPYFYPSDDILNQLVAAAYAGIDVRIIVPGNVDDKRYILLINRYNYKRLLNAGVKIYEYFGFMHGKEVIIDNDLSLMGTFNFDHRSLYSNFETALLVNNKEWNLTLINEFLELTKTSKLITKSEWYKTQTWINKIKVKIFNLIHPLF